MLRVGPRAMAGLIHFEGLRLRAYKCPADVWTIGYGNTYYEDGTKVKAGDVITKERALELKANILEKEFARHVRKSVGPIHTTPAQFGAMVMLAYNIGIGGFRRSQVLRNHLDGNWNRAAKSFRGWIRAGGKISRGLIRRRDAEAALYRGDIETYDKMIRYGKFR